MSANVCGRSGLMSTYTTEILPYGLRAKGYVWLNFSVTLALVCPLPQLPPFSTLTPGQQIPN
jgi:hypothetical protein